MQLGQCVGAKRKEKREQRGEEARGRGGSGLERQDSTKGYGTEEERGELAQDRKRWRLGGEGGDRQACYVLHPARTTEQPADSIVYRCTYTVPLLFPRCMYAREDARARPALLLASPSHRVVFRKPPPPRAAGSDGDELTLRPCNHVHRQNLLFFRVYRAFDLETFVTLFRGSKIISR